MGNRGGDETVCIFLSQNMQNKEKMLRHSAKKKEMKGIDLVRRTMIKGRLRINHSGSLAPWPIAHREGPSWGVAACLPGQGYTPGFRAQEV